MNATENIGTSIKIDNLEIAEFDFPIQLLTILYQPPINWTNSEKQFDCFVSNQSQRYCTYGRC